eukprot:3842334-Amphidinium_carterae.1
MLWNQAYLGQETAAFVFGAVEHVCLEAARGDDVEADDGRISTLHDWFQHVNLHKAAGTSGTREHARARKPATVIASSFCPHAKRAWP